MLTKRRLRFVVCSCTFSLGCTMMGFWFWYYVGNWAGTKQILLVLGTLTAAVLIPAALIALAYRLIDRKPDVGNKNASQY